MKTNEIIGGLHHKYPAYVYCDGVNVYEMSGEAANGYGRSADYAWLTITDLRCYEIDRENLRDTFPKLSEEAYRAILNANVRGVEVEVFGYDKTRSEIFSKLIDLRNKLRVIERSDKKLIEKMNKVLRKNFEQEIVLDELFQY